MTTLTSEVIRAGAPIGAARAAMILVHGRGASAEGMLGLADAFGCTDVAYVAPQARSGSWYPYSFMAPLSQNEPHLSNALKTLSSVVEDLEREGMPSERIVLLGFSQGACLALEFAARNARRFGSCRGLERRADRARGHAEKLSGFACEHAGVSRLQRRRLSHSASAGARIDRGAHQAWWQCDRDNLPRHGPHDSAGRSRSR